MRILFISPRQCWPASSGAKLREYHFLKALGERGDVTYLHFTDPGSVEVTRADLPFCHEVVGVPKPKAYGAKQLALGLLSRWPLLVVNYTSEAMRRAVARVTDKTKFDLIHLDSIHMIRYAESHRNVIYNWHNIESEAMRRYADEVPSRSRRWYALRTAIALDGLEKRILHESLGHVVCSERERQRLIQVVPQARIEVVENGVDVEYFSAGGCEPGKPRDKIVFVGAMDYHPNITGVTAFAQRIWPAIRERMPALQLALVGSNPGPAVRALGELPGVIVTGTVPDVRPWYHEALAAVVPLRNGGGTRLKIPEAMAAGVPVISTALGAEGLAVAAGEHFLLADADDPAQWLNHLDALTRSPRFREQLTRSALEVVQKQYDWQMLGWALSETYSRWHREAV